MTQNHIEGVSAYNNYFNVSTQETKQLDQQIEQEEDIIKFIVLGDVPIYEGQSVFGDESNQEHYKIQVTKKGNRYYDENGVRFYICKQCSYKNTNHRALGGHVQKKHRYQVDKKITKPQSSQF